MQKGKLVTETFAGRTVEQWRVASPLVGSLIDLDEVTWFNPLTQRVSEAPQNTGLTARDVRDAARRLQRFAPYLHRAFPETEPAFGIVESPLVAVENFQEVLGRRHGRSLPGKMWAKLDNLLPISGSIKARGGIYDVLQHAEKLALATGRLTLEDDYSMLAEPEWKEFFSNYSIATGSTGNLGLSIGVVAAAFGFKTTVHMSADAAAWKKQRLREQGVAVLEHDSDYTAAVAAGREQAAGDPATYFIDDEGSVTLFLGYAVAGLRLGEQLAALKIPIDPDHPLFVYLPCGVGGAPGGVTFGLKTSLGDNVHCFFAEPTHSPSVLLGVYTGLHNQVAVQDFGIDNVTAADGLACGRPSRFVGPRMQALIDGFYTIEDDELFRLLALFHDTEGIKVEPSAAAGLAGPWRVFENVDYLERIGVDAGRLSRATHIAWCTGGSLVPATEMREYVDRGRSLL